mgnify:CR=1 FL=1
MERCHRLQTTRTRLPHASCSGLTRMRRPAFVRPHELLLDSVSCCNVLFRARKRSRLLIRRTMAGGASHVSPPLQGSSRCIHTSDEGHARLCGSRFRSCRSPQSLDHIVARSSVRDPSLVRLEPPLATTLDAACLGTQRYTSSAPQQLSQRAEYGAPPPSCRRRFRAPQRRLSEIHAVAH